MQSKCLQCIEDNKLRGLQVKALIIYGSRWGGTAEIAEKIGETLAQESFDVDVVNAKKKKPPLDPYDLIIVGSGIRADKWTKQAINFLKKNAEVLRKKKIALFVSCQMADQEQQVSEKAKSLYLQRTVKTFDLRPLSLGFFGGFLDFRKTHGLFVDILVRINRKSLKNNGLDISKVYDKRDWRSIEIWARSLAKAAA